MYWLSKAMYRNGFSIIVLTTDRGISNSLPRNTWINVDFGKVQYVRTIKNSMPLTLLIKSISALFRTDAVYLASFFYPLSFLIAPFAILLNVKVVWAPRGEVSVEALKFSYFRKKCVLFLIRLFKKKIIFHATSMAEVEDIYNAIGKCRVEYIPNGMELPTPVQSVTEKKDLLYLGRIHPIKGLELLLQAVSQTKAFKISKHRLLIAGYPQQGYDLILYELIQRLSLQEKVVFLGRIEGTNKDNIIANAYALVLPSFSENFGAVVAESLAQGTPVISSLGTPWSILNTNGAGYHVSHEPSVLSSVIDKLFSLDHNEYSIMRQNARALAERHLGIDQYIPLWKTLLENK